VRIISSNRIIRKGLTVVLLALAGMVLTIGPTSAITFGQPDGNRHPNVGALLADYDPDSPGPDIICSGTLIAPTVFLTAAHCTAFLEAEGISPGRPGGGQQLCGQPGVRLRWCLRHP
jgi:hypothetical protein